MFINPKAMQRHIKELDFPNKSENVIGLQVADFVPNNFARRYAGLDKLKFNINNALWKSLYDGDIKKSSRFGMKLMP